MTLPPRLRAVLDASLQYRITEIVAPAGFGKSTAIDALTRTRNFCVARIGQGEEAASGLMQALCAAVAPHTPDLERFLPVAYGNATAGNTTSELARWFVDGLSSGDHAIAVDDLQHLGEDAVAWHLLQEIIELSGPKIRWVLASRTWLHLPSVNWIASGIQASTIQEVDLAFTADDVIFIATLLDLTISPEAVAQLVEATHGWPLLIMYSLRLLSTNRDAQAVVETVRGRGIEVVAERLLSELSVDDRRLLLAVSLYDGVVPEVLERTNPTATRSLRRLASNGVPLIQGNDRRWRLHEIIRRRLLARDPVLCVSEAQRLCHQLDSADTLELALGIALVSGSPDLVQTILEGHISYFLFGGNSQLVRRAIAIFSPEAIDSSAKLAAVRGTLEMKFGQSEIAVAFLCRAIELSEEDSRAYLLTCLGLMLINWQGHAAEGLDVLRTAAELSLPSKMDDACEVLAGTAVGFALGGEKEVALLQIGRAIELLPRVRSPLVEARVYLRAGQIAGGAGLPEQAKVYLERSIAISEKFGFFDVLMYGFHLAKNVSAYDSEALAIKYAQRAADCAGKILDHDMLYLEKAALFVYSCRAGKMEEARTLKHALCPVPRQRRPRLEAMILMTAAHLSMLDSNLEDATALLSQIESFGEPAMDPEIIPFRKMMYQCYSAMLDQLRAAHHDAVTKARRSISLASISNVDGFALAALPEIEISKICSAAIFAFNGRISEAQPILDDMAANAQEQYRRDLASWVSELIGNPSAEPSAEARARANGIIVLLQRCAAGVEIVPLTPAERRVLEALAEGHPTKEIAASTGRSSKTVNNQITSILRKLQARSRGEAVARARRRGLLSTGGREPASV